MSPTMLLFVRAIVVPVCLTLATLSGVASSPADDLLAAARASDAPKLVAALAAGADVNSKDAEGRTALMLAAEAQAFSPCRELLWAGADANAKDKAGRTALKHIAEETDANIPLRFLLRCYAYLQQNAQRAKERPGHPNLVMISENTVNYLHPKLKAAYQINDTELHGKPGVDDDKNGFVDDVYGWVPDAGAPYQIRESQVDAYLKYHDVLARILKVDVDSATGKISPLEAALRLSEYTNPLADLFGPVPGTSDGEFLNMLKEAAHGTHVAGIVVDSSQGAARLQTLAVNFAEQDRRLLGPDTDSIIEQIHAASFDPEVVLKDLRARLLDYRTERGRVTSRYLRATGAGIVNMSWGGGLKGWIEAARTHILVCNANRRQRTRAPFLDLGVDRRAARWGLELFTAASADVALVMYENPDVLFVMAAGNDKADDDSELPLPAYLGRFFPNALAVASTDAAECLSSFSNFGAQSVDIAAPGEHIVSTLFPDANISMDGTSMSAPCVAGVAALMRSIAPAVGAAELRRLIDYTAIDDELIQGFVSSGGIVDRETLRGCFSGDNRARSKAQARIACNAALLADEAFPSHAVDAERAASEALKLDPANPEAWRARARTRLAAGDGPKALEAIDKALKLDPNSEPAWMDRAMVASRLQDNQRLFESLGRAIDVLAAQGERGNFMRARRLVLRASLHLQVQEVEPARADVRLAFKLNPNYPFEPELAALL